MHLVGAVGETEGPGVGPQVREREVLADAAAPCAVIALSITHSAIAGVMILMAWISVCAPLLPTVSISHAVFSTSSRACSIRTRDSAIHSWITP